MKIAVMMRVTDQILVWAFSQTLWCEPRCRWDRMNSYLLLYKEPKHFGRFANFANVNCLALGIHPGVLLLWWLSLCRF